LRGGGGAGPISRFQKRRATKEKISTVDAWVSHALLLQKKGRRVGAHRGEKKRRSLSSNTKRKGRKGNPWQKKNDEQRKPSVGGGERPITPQCEEGAGNGNFRPGEIKPLKY